MNNDLKGEQKDKRFLGIRFSAIIEIALFFLALFIIAFLAGLPFNFFTTCPHPFWIIVILISAQYGTKEGLLAAFAATIILLLGPLPEKNALQDQFEYFFVIGNLPLLLFVTAVILGELRMKHIRETNRQRQLAIEAVEREQKVAEAYSSLKKIKERLEIHIASETQTTMLAISAFKQLGLSGKEGIIQGAINLIKVLVAPEVFSIYFLIDGELKRIAFEGDVDEKLYTDHFGPDSMLFQDIVNKKRVLSVNALNFASLGKEGVLAVPIVASEANEVRGMIIIEQMPFLRLRTTTIETLHMIGEWVGTALARETIK
jgi:hypothetical protein